YKAEKSEAKNLSRMCLGRPAIAIKLKEDTEYYDKYSENINTFVFLNMNDINLRFNKIEEIITKKQTPQESSRLVSKLLEAWLALTRDCLLIKYSQKNLVQHSIIIEQLENIEKKFTVQQLLNLNNILINAKMYLRSNVNSKNILEYIAVNI
ncbi:MAG: hypothetical protein NT091_01635, partial [Candidatus Falkowbacteria bacterium]|nr:hypothetical protein [Candidatus Falkowbacteria bacterium]